MTRTREEDRVYQRGYRARKRAQAAMPRSTAVADAVTAELAPLASATTHPGLVAAALAMAKILDNPAQSTHHSSAARSLGEILTRLHSKGSGGGGKLAAMRLARHDE